MLFRGLILCKRRYGTPAEVAEFEKWMRCYGKAKSMKDKSGRTLWYFEDQVLPISLALQSFYDICM